VIRKPDIASSFFNTKKREKSITGDAQLANNALFSASLRLCVREFEIELTQMAQNTVSYMEC
jgi:hypothetical protein